MPRAPISDCGAPGTPKPIAAKLQTEIARIASQPDFLKRNFIERVSTR